MASTLRVALRRQARLPLSAQKAFTNQSIFTNPSPALQILNSWSPPALPSKWKNPTRTTSISSLRIAAFHVTTRRSILPPGPQVIAGTANDPAPIPPVSPTHGSYHWTFERSCIIDYFPKQRVPKTRKFLDWTLRAATVLVGVGLYEFETNDVGVTEAIKRIWTA
ncbi:membrane anchor subunit of succinate dehydrogenase, Sdh4 [Schaereria dolodes]|nr:membrane anchor subunit of succinate dehydrogenase, Sdh4 [Schaereria dolodes]